MPATPTSHPLPTPLIVLLVIIGAIILLRLIPMRDAAEKAGNAKGTGPTHALGWALMPKNLPKVIGLILVLLIGYLTEGQDMELVLAALAGSPASAQDIFTLSLFGAVIMTGIALLPVAAFMVRGWKIKKDDVLSSLGPESIKLYVDTFLTRERDSGGPNLEPEDIFETMYNRRYGLYRLREPLILLVFTLFPLSLLVAHTALARLSALNGGKIAVGSLVLPGEALAAVAGAYTFVIAALVRSALNYSLPPLTLVNSALRMLVAAPVGYAVAAFGLGKSEFIAFAIGAFPLDQVQTIFSRLTAQYLNPSTANAITDDTSDKASALDGVDQPTADALTDGDITTALQLAYCDPVQLSLRTNIDFDVILDLQSEALAYIYLGAQLDPLRPLGLRGAVEISNLMAKEPNPPTPAGQPKSDFDLAFTAAQLAAKIDAGGLRNCFFEIANDPYTIFLVKSWECRNTGNTVCAPAKAVSGTASGTISGSSGSSGGAVTSSMASAVVVSGGSAIQSSGTAGSGAIASG